MKKTPLWKKISLKEMFKRKPNRFIDLLVQQAQITVEGMEALVAYFEKPTKKRAEAVSQAESAADEIRRIMIDELNRTFITPFDREDIHALSRAIDDMLDYTADASVLGKPVLKDLEEGNVTFPIISLLQRATPQERAFVQEVVESHDFSMENKAEIVRLVERHGALDELQELAHDYAREARSCLTAFPESEYREALLELPDLVITRER